MARRISLSLKDLEETRSFYNVELEKEGLTEKERNKYSRALKIIEKLIEREKEKRNMVRKIKDKKCIRYDDKNRIEKRGFN